MINAFAQRREKIEQKRDFKTFFLGGLKVQGLSCAIYYLLLYIMNLYLQKL